MRAYYGFQPPSPIPSIKEYFGPLPPTPPANIREYYGLPPSCVQEYYGLKPPPPPPNLKEHYNNQLPSHIQNTREYYGPQPPSQPLKIKEYFDLQPPPPPPHIKENYGIQLSPLPSNVKGQCVPQPPSPPTNIRENYGPQPHSSTPSNKGYYDIKYPSFIPTNKDHNSLVEPNNEGFFGPELQSILPCGSRLNDRQFVPPASNKELYEPHPPSPRHRQSYDASSPLSNDFEYYTATRQFSPLHNRGTSSFRDASLEDSSLLQVSIIPSVSFTIHETTHVKSPVADQEDSLALARNVPYVSGDVTDRTLKP
jgi:hypothetical protein